VSGPIDQQKIEKLRLVAFDVDGVFTDGRFYLSDDGVESKAFHTQDGYGVRRLIEGGLEVAVISGRKSKAVELRMAELGVGHVILGCRDKVAAFDQLLDQLGLEPGQAAYAGDDLPDMALLQHAGTSFAVANAVPEIQAYCDYTTRARGGHGAVREICDLIVQALPV
jgi:3-deoxy-D-manno-octulosonate 8-phosphate phosphatase (KDO 8-P phosphatase)